MFVRQVKRKCDVRGCKNTDCFAISRTREVGNTVIICKSCLGKALGAIDEIDPRTKSNIPAVDNTSAPSLFFNAKAHGTEAKATVVDEQHSADAYEDSKEPELTDNVPPAPDAEDSIERTDPQEDVTGFKCSICDKKFDSEKGLKTHLRYCKPQTNKE